MYGSAFQPDGARGPQLCALGILLLDGCLNMSCTHVCRHVGYVQLPAFHLRHDSPDGLGAEMDEALSLVSPLLVIARTADSIVLRQSLNSGSGSPRWAHSRSVWLVAKHSSHPFTPDAMPVKHIVYMELIADHRGLLVRAAWRRKAESYRTHARPE